jgi:23S rRNA (cytosine1962-C5)-methyltransferase
VAILHADSSEIADSWLPEARAELQSLCASAYVKVHARGLKPPDKPAWGPPRDEVRVTEHGVRYLVRPAAGLSVGLFLDMREVRRWLRKHSPGKQVLNLFSYTCSFGVCAGLGGAERVVNIDVSRPYLEWGKANYALNGLACDAHDFIYGDASDWLARFARRQQQFEIVVIDPPSFSSTPFSVTRDYVRLVESAVGVVAPGGTLVAATNHTATSAHRFEDWLANGLARAGRSGQIVERWHEPRVDFPVPGGGRPYLKARAVELD